LDSRDEFGVGGSLGALKPVQLTFLDGETAPVVESRMRFPLPSTALKINSTSFFGLLAGIFVGACNYILLYS
jgi:hypothetical protein